MAKIQAQKYGTEVVLAAWGAWLCRDNLSEEMRIGPNVGNQIPMKTWLLHEFLTSSTGMLEINRQLKALEPELAMAGGVL
jgi:hypothetical protein